MFYEEKHKEINCDFKRPWWETNGIYDHNDSAATWRTLYKLSLV